MVEVSSHIGLHGSNTWQDESVGLSHCHFWTTPEDVGTCQPFSDEHREFTICLDGRIDNRAEIQQCIRDNGDFLGSCVSDAQLILACYRRRGPDVFSMLVGDFAVVIWDARGQRLVCARDALGRRQLVYHFDSRRFICGTLLRQVFCDGTIAGRLSEQTVADYLSAALPNSTATFFDGIHRLPAGHWLDARINGGVYLHQYWNPAQIALAANSADDFTDQFREHFFQAVGARMRTTSARIAIQVSGGLDSTAIVSAFCHLNDKSQLGLEALALQNSAQHPAADEGDFQRAVLAKFPMTETMTAAEDYWAFRDPGIPAQHQEEPFEADYAARMMDNLETTRRLGAQVILSGDGGDEIGGSSWYLIDRLLRGNLTGLLSEFNLRARGRRVSSQYLLKALTLSAAAWLRRSRVSIPRRLPHWFNRDLARKLGLYRRYREPTVFISPAREDLYQRMRLHWVDPHYSAESVIHQSRGVETRQPFVDRRLFEWALSIPPATLGENGRMKAPMRRALADLMPDSILNRSDKGDYIHYWDLGLRIQERGRILRLLERPISEELGFINAELLRNSYLHYCQGGKVHRRQLWNALTLEKWLRHRSGFGV